MCFQKESTLELWIVEDQSLVFITFLSKSLTPRKPVSVVIEENAIWKGTKEPHVLWDKRGRIIMKICLESGHLGYKWHIQPNTVTNLHCEDTRELVVVVDHILYMQIMLAFLQCYYGCEITLHERGGTCKSWGWANAKKMWKFYKFLVTGMEGDSLEAFK